ncbi:MAG: bifunctional 4-hydroxy-2-oxoglutarate aldolase/2-dehydro-3-deoxy-phosphogluconate aldolase [Cetobacterium sp.]
MGIDKLIESRIVAVIRGKNHDEAKGYVKATIEGGIKGIELTFTIPNMPTLLKELKVKYPKAVFGVGSVLNLNMVEEAIEMGAEYIVSPGYIKEVGVYCNQRNIPYIPGCMTITEMLEVIKDGHEMIKLFPGELYGPKFIKSVKEPIPNIKIMPTGGVNEENIVEWFENGATLVGVGGSLLQEGDLEKIKYRANKLVKKIKGIRGENV